MRDESAGGLHPVPGFAPPTTARSKRAVTEILDAARTLFLEVGRDGFSLREVARRADYSPAALYNYFDGVEALVNLLALEGVQALGSYLEAVPSDTSSPRRLRALGNAYLAFASAEPARYRLVFATLAAPTPRWTEYTATAYPFTLLIQECASGLDAGSLIDRHAVGAAGLAYGLWATVHGIAMLSAHHLAAIEHGDIEPISLHALDSAIAGITTPLGTVPDHLLP